MAHVKNQFSPEPNSNKRPLASSRESFYKSESKQDCFEEKQKTWKDDFFFFKKERRKEIAQTFSNDIILLLQLLLLLRFTQHLHFSRDEGTHTHTLASSVWPDLAKFRLLGNILKVLGISLMVGQKFWNCLGRLLFIEVIFFVANGQKLNK